MTQIFDEKGNVVPVTVIEAGPCVVVQKKTVEKDGYSSVKLGYSDVAARKVSRPARGQFKTLNPGAEEELRAALKAAENETDPQRKKMMFKETNVKFTVKKYLKEFKLDDADKMNVGDEIKADIFAAGDKVDVTGTSKGHGFSGVIKRWGAHRLRMSHGTGPVHRQVGSMGANSDPSRVYKNKKMAGQYGRDKVTTLNLKVVKVDAEKNLIAIKGAVPGARGSIVFIRNTVK